MTADREHLETLADSFLRAWNEQDVEAVLDWYTDDVEYRDPNTRGPVLGCDAMRAYLTKLFATWDMRWERRDLFPLTEPSGSAFLWRATLRPARSPHSVTIDGMDLAILEGDRVRRNEVYFDRTALTPLLADR